MTVDSSAILAILFEEPEGDAIHRRLGLSRSIVGAPTVLETSMAFASRTSEGAGTVRTFLTDLGVEVVPFEAEHAAIASSAFARYGKGRGSRASLNYGDCMTYAIARLSGLPVLCKGDDFAHTDLKLVDY